MTIRINKTLEINGITISYINGGFKFHSGGGKIESNGQVAGSPTHKLNIEENFGMAKVEVENTDENIAQFRKFWSVSNGNHTIRYGDDTYLNCTLNQNPDDQETLGTSEHVFHTDPISQAF